MSRVQKRFYSLFSQNIETFTQWTWTICVWFRHQSVQCFFGVKNYCPTKRCRTKPPVHVPNAKQCPPCKKRELLIRIEIEILVLRYRLVYYIGGRSEERNRVQKMYCTFVWCKRIAINCSLSSSIHMCTCTYKPFIACNFVLQTFI